MCGAVLDELVLRTVPPRGVLLNVIPMEWELDGLQDWTTKVTWEQQREVPCERRVGEQMRL